MRILMSTRGWPYAEVVLRFGAQISYRAGEPPTVLVVINREEDRPRADSILARARELLKPAIPDVRTRIRIGHPAEEIIREAEEGHYDLLIVGERKQRNLVARILQGSTAAHVVEHAPCPVIIAKGETTGRIRRILLCESGAQRPSLLTRFTAQLTGLIEGEEDITVLHVMSQMSAWPGTRGKNLRANAEELIEEHTPEGELLEQDIHLLERPGIVPHPKVRHGLVVDEILAEAQSGDYDLVVIGAHRSEGWRRILLDDLAHQIMVQVNRPILVVR